MYRHALRTSSILSRPLRQALVSTFARDFQSTMAASAATRVSNSIIHDHAELKDYYNNIKKATRDDDKIKWQNQFVWELARHSIAEELVVYPAFEEHIPNGLKMAEKDRTEHQQVCLPPSATG